MIVDGDCVDDNYRYHAKRIAKEALAATDESKLLVSPSHAKSEIVVR